MENYLYYGMLTIFILLAINLFRNGNIVLGICMAVISAFVYYQHQGGSISDDIYQGIDTNVEKSYDEEGIRGIQHK